MANSINREVVVNLMKNLDLCFMHTVSGGEVYARPMSNNKDIDWDGANWFFSNGNTRKVEQISSNPNVALTFESESDWIVLRGTANLHQDDEDLFEKHWVTDLERWFEQSIDTPGLTLIEVVAEEAELFGAAGEGIVKL